MKNHYKTIPKKKTFVPPQSLKNIRPHEGGAPTSTTQTGVYGTGSGGTQMRPSSLATAPPRRFHPSQVGGRQPSLRLTHRHKPAAFGGLCCGGALVFQDAEPFVEGHRRLLWRRRENGDQRTPRDSPTTGEPAVLTGFPTLLMSNCRGTPLGTFFSTVSTTVGAEVVAGGCRVQAEGGLRRQNH